MAVFGLVHLRQSDMESEGHHALLLQQGYVGRGSSTSDTAGQANKQTARKTLPEERMVKWVSVIVVAAYLATLAVVTGHCRPISRAWQVYPYAGGEAT